MRLERLGDGRRELRLLRPRLVLVEHGGEAAAVSEHVVEGQIGHSELSLGARAAVATKTSL